MSAGDLTSSRGRIIHLCLELTSTVQRDCTVYQMEEKILEVSQALNAVCEKTVQVTSDPSNREMSCLEEIHITNIRPGEVLGMYIKSTYDGLHVITGTTENSPADQTQRIHAGDEVIQVNKQTVVGWQLKNLVEKMRAESGSITLMLRKRPAGTAAAPLRNLRWRPALVQGAPGFYRFPRSPDAPVSEGNASILDLHIPPPPSGAPYDPREKHICPHPTSSYPSLDADTRQRLVEESLPRVQQPVPIRLRQRSASRCKPRPVSMPVDSILGVSVSSSRRRARGQKGGDDLPRCLSNERISAIAEEEPGFPPPSRGRASARGVDHTRGSRCFMDADLHGSATIPYQDAAGRTPAAPAPSTASKTASSVLGGWLARLRLLSH